MNLSGWRSVRAGLSGYLPAPACNDVALQAGLAGSVRRYVSLGPEAPARGRINSGSIQQKLRL